MKKIPSFTIDHIRLVRGIFVSRKDELNGGVITTFDVRMKEPNREPALGQGALQLICATNLLGKIKLSIGDLWDASPATTC